MLLNKFFYAAFIPSIMLKKIKAHPDLLPLARRPFKNFIIYIYINK